MCVPVEQAKVPQCTEILFVLIEYQWGYTIVYLLLATGRAISNLARNWKYCSSVCWVKPVPTNSICTTDITTGSQHHHHHTRRLRKPKSMFFCNLSSPWGPQLGSLHSWPQSERTWGAWSSPGILTATQDTGSRGYTGRGWCQGSAAGSRSLSRSWWLDVVAKKRRVIKTWCFFMNNAVKGVTISQTLGRPTGIWIQR